MASETEQNTIPSPSLESVCMVSSGLFHIRRGYETFMLDLFDVLSSDNKNVHLVTGSTIPSSDSTHRNNVLTLPTLHRNNGLSKMLFSSEQRRYYYEQLTLALSGFFLTRHWQRQSIIYTCDPNFARFLMHFKDSPKLKLFQNNKAPYQVVFGNCGPMNPNDCKLFDHVQEFTPLMQQQSQDAGIEQSKSSLIPMGIWPGQFNVDVAKDVLRQKYNLPQEAWIVLTVASLDEPFKRIPFVIDVLAEFKKENQDNPKLASKSVFFLMAGNNQHTPHAKQTLESASKLLGEEGVDFTHITVPYQDIKELYAASDVFVLGSLQEGFGKVYLEAIASSIPVLCHDSINTQWIVKATESRLNMEDPEALKNALSHCLSEPVCEAMVKTNKTHLENTFHWDSIKQQYQAMFNDVLAPTHETPIEDVIDE